jgi:penicillin-insensitive murein endopeptidase
MKRYLTFVACTFLFACAGAPPEPENPWAKLQSPAPGSPRSIGKPGAGCLVGAVSLDADGEGYKVMRISRRRFYGHPVLVDFIKSLGKAVHEKDAPSILVGDLGQVRGGPMPTGHLSHQIGLDADIWFLPPQSETLTLDDRERISSKSMLSKDGESLNDLFWSNSRDWVLIKAASFDEVDRIFVNPVIKRELCIKHPNEPALHKLRPWWGHDDHFHVRMKCQAGDTLCEPTEAIPAGRGCDSTLDWWFSQEAKQKGEETSKKLSSRVLPKLPAECDELALGRGGDG